MKSGILIILFFAASIVNGQNQKEGHPSLNGISCKTCHTCDIPTKGNPCFKPCPREKMITIERTPDEGPIVIKMDKFKSQSGIYSPVIFSHRLHAEMSGMSGGCKMCHHYNPPGEVANCSDCHELNRKRADISKPDLKGADHRQCMECHRQWSGEVECVSCHNQKNNVNKTAALKKTALKVHPKMAEPVNVRFETPKASGKFVNYSHSDHTKVFGIDCGKCHSNEGCVKCHAKDKIKPLNTGTPEQKHQKCAKCHDTKNNCSMCHGNSVSQGFDHFARTGFDLSRHHVGLTCARCHINKEKFTGLTGDCSNCHGAWNKNNFQHKITGLTIDETHTAIECTDCHQEKNYAKPVCTNCHDDKSYPKDVPGKLKGISYKQTKKK